MKSREEWETNGIITDKFVGKWDRALTKENLIMLERVGRWLEQSPQMDERR